MNILTFDIEEWFFEYGRGSKPKKMAELDSYLSAILDKLTEHDIKATFFCLGEMGRLFPEVIRKIQYGGHEVGCHSDSHQWLNRMSLKECREDTHRAVDSIEQCMGQKVRSYRAPAFSIGEHNLWVFEILAENGIERDASVYPTARDFGGFPQFGQKTPCFVEYNGIRMKEFPICTTRILGKEMAYSGGGFFRFFPIGFVQKKMLQSDYNMCYFHIGDLTPENLKMKSPIEYEAYYKEPGTLKNRIVRHIKNNFGKKGAFEKMIKLVDSDDFIGLQKADEIFDWNNATVVKF